MKYGCSRRCANDLINAFSILSDAPRNVASVGPDQTELFANGAIATMAVAPRQRQQPSGLRNRLHAVAWICFLYADRQAVGRLHPVPHGGNARRP